MDPQVTVGVFAQASWPGAGDIDDCWVVSDLQGVHAVAPWLPLVTVPKYREVAGNPDQPGRTGGTIAQSRLALKTLYPTLAIEAFLPSAELTWATFAAKIQGGRVASVNLVSDALPLALRHGGTGGHRCLVFPTASGWRIMNPLARAHSRPEEITEAALRAAIAAYGPGIRCIVFPDPDDAIRTHPAVVALSAQLQAAQAAAAAADQLSARLTAVKGKVAALAADVAND